MPTTNADIDSFGDRGPLLRWLVFTGLCIFAFILLWRFGLVRQMVASDRTYISSIIGLLYVAASLHCLWRTIVISREGDAARRSGALIASGPGAVASRRRCDPGRGRRQTSAGSCRRRTSMISRSRRGCRDRGGSTRPCCCADLAGRLRGSNQFGAFASDTLMKLGLLGTIIGFIMMLAPIAGMDPGDRSTIRSSMNLMSDGMAVAMYTTLAGLVGSILVRIQYYMLDDATAKLFAYAVGLTEVRVVSVLEDRPEAAE